MTPPHTFGIIGQGSFGHFLSEKLAPHFQIATYDRSQPDEQLAVIAQCDFVILAVPFESYAELLPQLDYLLGAESIIVDVCSVKLRPLEAIRQQLPGRTVLATHPLFGPQSAALSLEGHTIIICPDETQAELYAKAESFFQRLGLKVERMTADEHDRLMADLQGLTFFVAQTLAQYGVTKRPIITPTYQKLLDLAELDRNHSAELFRTVENANPYTAERRKRLRHVMRGIEAQLAVDAAAAIHEQKVTR